MTPLILFIAQTGSDIVGLTDRAHLLLALVSAAAILFVLRMLRRRQMSGKYALLWLVAVIPLALMAAFPGLLNWVAERVGVFYPPALFLLVAVAFLFLIVVQFSYELSRLNERTRALAEEIALLRQEQEAADR